MKKSTVVHITSRLRGGRPPEQDDLSMLIEALAIPAIAWQPNGIISSANPEFCRLMGYTKDELIGQNLYAQLFPGELGDQWDSARLHFSMGRNIDQYVTEILHKDGSLKVMTWTSAARFEANGLLMRVLCLGFDITPLAVAQREITRLARLMSDTMASWNRSG